MMLDLEMVQDGEYFRANGILVCFVEDSKVFVQTVDGKTDCGAATKLNVDAVVKNLVQKEAIEDLMCYEGQVLIVDTKYYPKDEDEDEDYEGYFKCFTGGDVLINGLDSTLSWIDTNATNITEIVADILNVPYDAIKGISENTTSSFGINEVINRLSKRHFGVILFPNKFTFEFEKYLDS